MIGWAGLKLTLLTRAYCHLCDEMLAAVRPLAAARGATVAVVDVDADPTLERAYGELVPVLFAGDPETGIELCHYQSRPGPGRARACPAPATLGSRSRPGAKIR